VDTEIDPVALHHYLTFHSVVPAPHTILRGVRKLSPGTIMRIEPDGKRTEETYWEPVFERSAERANWSDSEWEEAILASLRTAVERRLVADVPGRLPALGWAGLQPDRRTARRGGPARPCDLLDRLRGSRG